MAQTTYLELDMSGAPFPGEVQAATRPDAPEDDLALARMLGAATLLGTAMTGGIAYGLWCLAAAALS